MADEGGGRKFLVETDFLFGLREGDRVHDKVSKALRLHRSGEINLSLLSSAVVEFRVVLYSHGLGPGAVAEAAGLALAELADAGVRECVEVSLEDLVIAERLRQEHEELGFFDSIHAAAAKRRRTPLLSADEIYSRLGIPFLNLEEL